MEHEQARELIDSYVDGELEISSARAMEKHLQGCPECRGAEARIRGLHAALVESNAAFRAPTRLRRNVRAAIRREARGESTLFGAWLPWATAAACALLLGLFLFKPLGQRSQDHFADEVIANHVRSLLATHLVDIPSSDQHTVKPWFNGKIDFAPEVHDFAAEGFPLVGGRLDYLQNRTVGALVYRRDKHVINVFLLPAAAGSKTETAAAFTRRGYHLMHWSKDGIAYWAISDLNAEELRRFVELFSR